MDIMICALLIFVDLIVALPQTATASEAVDPATSTTAENPEVGTVSETVAGYPSETHGEATIADAATAANDISDNTGIADGIHANPDGASNDVAATSLAPANEDATTADIHHGEAIHPTTTAEATAVSAEQQRQQAELAEQQRQQAEWDALTPEQQQLRRQQAEEHQAALLEQQQQAELAEQQRQQAEWDALSPEQQQLRRQQWEEHQRLLEHQRQQQLAHLTPEQQQQLLAQERQQHLAAQQLTAEQQQQLAHEQQLLAAQQQQHEVYQQQLAAHQQQQLLHQQHLAAHPHQVQQPIHQPLIPRIKRSDVRPVAGQDEELTRLNRFRFLNRTFASTAELKASCKEFGLSILRSDHDRVRLKLRGNTRTLLATFRLQKKSNPQQWRLSQDMSAEQVLQAWTTGNVNPEAVKLPTKRKSDDADLEDCKRDIKILHQQSPGLFQKVKEHVNHVFQSTGHSSSVVPTHLPMMHPNADVATAAAVQAHNLQQQQHQQYQQHLAAQHHHHQMQLAAAHAHDPRAAALEEQHRAQLQAQQHAWNVAQQRGYNVNI